MSMRSVSRRAAPVGLVCLLLLAVVASFLLASRGGPAPRRLSGHTVTLRLSDYSITPQSVSVPAGPIQIVAENRGIITHNLTVEDERLDSQGERVIVGSTHAVLPGSTAKISMRALTPGHYALTSTIANQADLGMSGTLIVR